LSGKIEGRHAPVVETMVNRMDVFLGGQLLDSVEQNYTYNLLGDFGRANEKASRLQHALLPCDGVMTHES
jgi:hypothetical protein